MSDAATDKQVPDNESIESKSETNPPAEDGDKEVTFAGYFTIAIIIKYPKFIKKTDRINWFYKILKTIDKDFEIMKYEDREDTPLLKRTNEDQIDTYVKNIWFNGSMMRGGF